MKYYCNNTYMCWLYAQANNYLYMYMKQITLKLRFFLTSHRSLSYPLNYASSQSTKSSSRAANSYNLLYGWLFCFFYLDIMRAIYRKRGKSEIFFMKNIVYHYYKHVYLHKKIHVERRILKFGKSLEIPLCQMEALFPVQYKGVESKSQKKIQKAIMR